ncbi:hypothetical protein IW262DRAFT_1484347 [Armillaria fumosa]|nr:hypothetical protein IW262DRAFT_1484347 [Armillaria fumosa]
MQCLYQILSIPSCTASVQVPKSPPPLCASLRYAESSYFLVFSHEDDWGSAACWRPTPCLTLLKGHQKYLVA